MDVHNTTGAGGADGASNAGGASNANGGDGWGGAASSDRAQIRPDGDQLLEHIKDGDFIFPGCPDCGGILKPDVVFFGDNLPLGRKEESFDIIDDADMCVVVSLCV
jgi:hypothetical protein